MKKLSDSECALLERLAFAVRLDEVAGVQSVADSSRSVNASIEEWEGKFRLPQRSLLRAWSTTLGVSADVVIRMLQSDRREAIDEASWSKIATEALQRAARSGCDIEVDIYGEQFLLCAAAWPWLRWARGRFELEMTNKFRGIAPRGFESTDVVKLFYPVLLSECQDIMLRTMALEVNVARMRGKLPVGTGAERLAYFCRNLMKLDRALDFWFEYPVLARFVIEACVRWVERSAELLERLDRDWDTLRVMRLVGCGSARLAQVRPVGDPHCDGKRVSILQFNEGSRLVYKPRPVVAEDAFGACLRWLNARGLERPLKGPHLCDRGGYGWVEFIDYFGNSEPGSRAGFYFRCGAILALSDALGVKDLSQDNIIAVGEIPYFVDVECLLSPVLRSTAYESALGESLLGVGLLPGFDVRHIDQSGLLPSGSARPDAPIPSVTGWGTDRLRIEPLAAKLPETKNTPGEIRLDDLREYAQYVVEGFSSAYRLIANSGRSLLSIVRSLASSSAQIRYLVRASAAYATIRDGLIHPNILRNSYDGEALIGKLAVSSSRALLPMLRSERRQLWLLDIPVFWTRAKSIDLWTADGNRIPRIFSLSGLSRARRRIRTGLNQGYLDYCARTACATMAQRGPRDAFVNFPERTGDIAVDCLNLAHAIGQHLLAKAWRNHDGKLEWMDRAEDVASHVGGGQTVRPMTEDLYSGLAGMLMFYTYLFALTSERLFEEVVDDLRTQIEAAVRNTCRAALSGLWGDRIRRTGGFTGVTSAMYALLHSSRFRGKVRMRSCARLLIEALSEWPAQDSALDWIGGAAGVIPILLAIDRSVPKVGALELARACGYRLVACAQKVGAGCGWVTFDKAPLTGFGHGASGIALALHKLGRSSGDGTFLSTAEGAVRFERERYNSEAGNWPDLRSWIPESERLGAYGWCAGAAGIGLAR
ncbi:MAG: type 2 lanthipeptide synthetase LanM, partial [Candidatus Acidiferrales bacterium]